MRSAFISKLIELAKIDPSVFLITGDLGFSVLEEYRDTFPDQYMNPGLSEQNMLGMAAGLAIEGKNVYVYSITPFLLYRGYEQIRNDICYQKLPIKLVGVGGGLTYGGEGETHHSREDIGAMSCLPGMSVFTPGDPPEVKEVMEHCYTSSGPCYIRLSRRGDATVHDENSIREFRPGVPLSVRGSGNEVKILAVGNTLPLAADVHERLANQGVQASVHSIHTMKPMDEREVSNLLADARMVVTLEEHVRLGGLFSMISMIVVQNRLSCSLLPFYLADTGPEICGTQSYLRDLEGLNAGEITQKILETQSLAGSGVAGSV